MVSWLQGYRRCMSEPDAAPQSTENSDGPAQAAAEGSLSAGETGQAVDGDATASSEGAAEVIIGEIPDAEDLTHMLWTVRCSDDPHGRIGTFETREEAEQAKRDHLLNEHGRPD
jgi:hypothetical protein